MEFQLSPNQTWAQSLLGIVYQPMVANKTGRYPLSLIVNQFSAAEQPIVKRGVEALVEMNLLALDGQDICITNKSEAILQGLNELTGKPANDVREMLKSSPAFSDILTKMNNESRLTPP